MLSWTQTRSVLPFLHP